jgi:hypothetical protein
MKPYSKDRKDSLGRKSMLNPTTLRGRWLILSSFARLRVRGSGGHGPACRPFEHVLQLQITPWNGDEESWTVFRNREDARKAGKVLYKHWNTKTDWDKLQKLEGKPLPKNWREDPSVSGKQLPVSSRWIRDLESTLARISIPPIAGPILPFSRKIVYKLSFWRSRQESVFSWEEKAPTEWQALENFFSSSRKLFQNHLEAEPLVPYKNLPLGDPAATRSQLRP